MTPQHREQFTAYARTMMPNEACGLLIIEKGHEEIVFCKNISPLPHSFAIDPDDFAAAEDRGEVVRVLHSHCYGSPAPSQTDLTSCELNGVLWSIVSVPNGDWHDFGPSGYKAPIVGREWAHGILDCYSLIKDYYREVLSIELPDFHRDYEWWHKGQNLYVDNIPGSGFIEVALKDRREHDILLMQIGSNVPNHGGIYLGNDRVLHHLHRRLSSRDIFGGYWLKHTVKVLRRENS
jgi:proteasome lid subunit RPN8/RPN11